MNVTRRGVTTDFKNTPYKSTIDYNGVCVDYHFSSSLYKSKFDIDVDINREKINYSLTNRFKFDINCDLLCDIKLYSIVEKRGFLIVANGREFECLNSIRLDGNQVIMKN